MANVEELDAFVVERGAQLPTDAEMLAFDLATTYTELAPVGSVEVQVPNDLIDTMAKASNFLAGLRLLQLNYGLTIDTRFVDSSHKEWTTHMRVLDADDPLRTEAGQQG